MSRWSKNILGCIGVTLLLLSILFNGCTTTQNTTTRSATTQITKTTQPATTTTATPTTRIVMDKDGNAIEIPYKVERVAPQIGAMAQMTALLGCSDRIVCAAASNLNDYFKKIFPQYVKANSKGLNTSNVEEVIASGAQVLYGPITDAPTIAKYKAAGIAVVPLNTFSNVQEMKDNIRKIAEILGGDAPAKAEAFCQYYQKQIDYVTNKTANVTAVKILSISYSAGALGTINSKDICSVYMTAAGGINVAGDLTVVTGISTENVIKWNPEIIITMNVASKNQILAEPTLQTVPAVKNGKVYVIPYGTYLWSVRSAEGAMMPLWLAKIMHPDIFTDLDMTKVVKEYYKLFYSYDVPDAEIQTILAGQ